MAVIKLGTIQKYHLLRCMGLIRATWEWNENPLEQMKFHAPSIFNKTINLEWVGRRLTDVEELIADTESVKLVDAFYTHIVSLDGEKIRWFKGKWYSKEDSYYEAVHQVSVSSARNIGGWK